MTKTELITAVDARLAQIKATLEPLDDDVAIEITALFPRWALGIVCTAGERLQYDEKLYRVVQTHTSQEGWEPPNVPALFTEVPRPGEIPVWKQPTGAQDAYMAGDKVHYPAVSDPIYVSDVDNNVWAPDVYGWSLVS